MKVKDIEYNAKIPIGRKLVNMEILSRNIHYYVKSCLKLLNALSFIFSTSSEVL